MVVLDRFPHFSMCFVTFSRSQDGSRSRLRVTLLMSGQRMNNTMMRGITEAQTLVMTLSSLCQQSLVLVHVGVTLVPGVVGVAHGHLGGGGQGHHGRGLDVLLHVGGERVGAWPLG